MVKEELNMLTTTIALLLKTGEEINIDASCEDVDHYQHMTDFKFKTYDCNYNELHLEYNKELFNEIEDMCSEIFYNKRFNPESMDDNSWCIDV